MKKFLSLILVLCSLAALGQSNVNFNKYLRMSYQNGKWVLVLDSTGLGTFGPVAMKNYVDNLPLGTGTGGTPVSTSDVDKWNTAYGWGNHVGLYPSLTGSYANPPWLTSFSYNKLINVPATFQPSPHGHGISDIAALQSALDGKQPVGSYANAIHNHGIVDITNLQALLDGKQPAGSYAAAVHIHGLSSLSQSGATTGQVPTWNGNTWAPATPSGGNGVTNLGISRTPTKATITSSTGTPVDIPSVDATNAGLATPDMLNQVSKSFTIRNALYGNGYFKPLYIKNDSTAIGRALRIRASSDFVVDTTASNDSLQDANLSLNNLPQSKINNLVSDLSAKAPLASPALVGVPTAPTASAGTNSTQIATTQFVRNEISAGGGSGIQLEVAPTFSAIATTTTKRLVQVDADESNNGRRTLYYHTGDSLYRFNTTAVALPIPSTPYVVEKVVRINFANQYLTEGNVTGWHTFPATSDNTIPIGYTKSNIKDSSGVATTFGFTTLGLFSNSGGGDPAQGTVGASFGCNDLIVRHGWEFNTTSVSYKITGLMAGKYYQFGFLSNTENFQGSSIKYAIGATETSTKVTSSNYGDCTAGGDFADPALLWIYNKQADGAGEITITATRMAGTIAHINAMIILQSNVAKP